MMTKAGFINLFWGELRRMRKVDDKITHEQVYEMLESEYEREFGQRRYSSFKSFRDNRDR
jgi:hypothetical protein